MVRGWITQPCLGELWQRAQHVLLVIRPCFRARPPVSGANLFNPSQGRIIVNITIIVIIIIIRRSGTDSGSPCGVLPKMMPAPPPPPHNTQFQCVVVSAHTHGYRSIAHSPQPLDFEVWRYAPLRVASLLLRVWRYAPLRVASLLLPCLEVCSVMSDKPCSTIVLPYHRTHHHHHQQAFRRNSHGLTRLKTQTNKNDPD